LHLTDRVKAGFIGSAVGRALFCYVTRSYYKRPVSVSVSGTIYESEYWIGPSAELRIHHHLFVYNTVMVSIVFVSS